MKNFEYNSEEDNNRFIHRVIDYLADYKKKLYEHLEINGEQIEKVLPCFTILTQLFTYCKFSDKDRMKSLAQESHELRMLPVPYGLPPHELIDVIDNERVMPGISRVNRLNEDFPYLDHHSLNKEKEEYEIFH